MRSDQRKRLREIRTFPSLVKHLREELDWPIATDDFEELTFDYTPEELGIDSKSAAKIQEIKRLRPLSPNQPWGIFFVKFEPKRLPVVALRRILGQVVLKKRASANNAERRAWAADDLLFVSNYGEGDERRITFAHFSRPRKGHDLPTLKVLGWDNLDTPLHLDDVAEKLTQCLAWPDDDADVDAWREQWRAAFTLRHREVITTSKELSLRLAELARAIRDRIKTALAIETESGPLMKLMKAFQKALVHDLDDAGFADMYAQTIAYGLLSARIANPEKSSAADLTSHMRTNPFLKELMEVFLRVGGRKDEASQGPGLDFDELGVSEVVELLDAANMEAIVRDFRDRNPEQDPLTHFYELFLNEFDQEQKKRLGTYYTPWPVVSFIVRSVDELLRTEFGLEDGLADTTTWAGMAERFDDLEIPESVIPDQAFVQILDPATGTGTFLVEVIDIIHRTMIKKWQAEGHGKTKMEQLWNGYVPKHLLPRLHGYEIQMAPYATAHISIGLKLYETGYSFGSDERARVYLTNALEPAQDFSGMLSFAIPALAHEAEAVNAIKRDQRFTVVIGNPPYAYFSSNLTDELRSMVDIYRRVDGETIRERGAINYERTIQDDYVKFHALADRLTEGLPSVRSFITNSAYLDNPMLRGMRCYLVQQWPMIWILNLHGDLKRDAGEDKNVFEIRTGVAISSFLRPAGDHSTTTRKYLDVTGSRAAKYDFVSAKTVSDCAWRDIQPRSPHYLLSCHDSTKLEELRVAPSIHDVFSLKSEAVKTNRDHLVIGHEDRDVLDRIRIFFDPTRSTAEVKEDLGLRDNAQWSIDDTRKRYRETFREAHMTDVAYRPFDTRRIYYHTSVVSQPRPVLADNVLGRENLVLLTCRRIRSGSHAHFFVTDRIAVKEMLSSADNCNAYPLYRYDGILGSSERATNYSSGFVTALADALQLPRSGAYGLPEGLSPEDVFGYAYAVFHSPAYRKRYAELLKIDFPRLPLTASLELFWLLAKLGSELVTMHLMKSPALGKRVAEPVGAGEFRVEKVSYDDRGVWIDRAKTCGFIGVRENVWAFHIGTYQVCEKWLKGRQAKGGKNPRPGRVLTDEDIDHYQKIVVALSETIRIMAEIDEVIESHGGWPRAFQTAVPIDRPGANYGSSHARGKKKK